MAGFPAETDLREGGGATAGPGADAGAALSRIVQPVLDPRHRDNHTPGMTAVHSPALPAFEYALGVPVGPA